ncbi:MAG: hypothetical protein V8Q42_10830 [Anaerovoracaceae bacterium]
MKRTNICHIGFHAQDVVAAVICLLCFALFFMQKSGADIVAGTHFAKPQQYKQELCGTRFVIRGENIQRKK